MFPFRLATTSYIYPDRIVPNVIRLAPYFDEVELVLFESEGENNLPEEADICLLGEISLNQQLGFNVHLPIDIFLGDKKDETRYLACSAIKKVIRRTLPLNPSLYTLHLDLRDMTGQDHADIEGWKARITQSLEEIMGEGIEPNRISIENLDYPFSWIEDIIERFGLSICLDIGHILSYGQDLQNFFEKYLMATSIIHLHGFENGVDHLGIHTIEDTKMELILSCLRTFQGIVSIEVFSFDDLYRSLKVFEEKWR